MIPKKLELKNFLSYGEQIQTIDFSEFSLICFSGKNGNGKSAILDAITWVIWGQARKISGTVKPDAGLLRLGQTQMFVSLEFEFCANTYRVRREFTKTYGKPIASLDFELFDPKQKRFIPLTEKRIRLTQAKIEKLLGLDYETFTNSAYLRQGGANEFSKKSPKERKQILTNILGFDFYDELQSVALSKVKVLQEERKFNIKLQEQAQKDIQPEKDIKNSIEKEEEKLNKINAKYTQQEKELNEYVKQQNLLDNKKNQFLLFQKDLKEKEGEFNKKNKEFLALLKTWKKFHAKSLKVNNLDYLEKNKKELLLKQKELQQKQNSFLSLQEEFLLEKDKYQKQKNLLQQRIDKKIYEKKLVFEQQKIESKQINSFLDQKQEQKKVIAENVANIDKELKEIQKDLSNYPVFLKKLEKTQNQFNKRREFYQVLVQRGNWTRKSKQELDKKQITINKEQSPSCPLCEQVLTAKRKRFLSVKCQSESGFFTKRLDRISVLLAKLKDLLFKQHKDLQEILRQDEFFKKMQHQREELTRNKSNRVKELELIEKEVLKLEKNKIDVLAKIKTAEKEFKFEDANKNNLLEKDEQLSVLMQKITQIEKDKKKLKHNKNDLLEMEEKIKAIDKDLQEFALFKEESDKQQERRNNISFLIKELKNIKNSKLKIKTGIKNLNYDQNDFSKLVAQINEVKVVIQKNNLEKEKALQLIGSLDGNLKRIDKIKKDFDDRKKKLDDLEKQIEEYQILSQTFGKNGIQALLLEQAIPQIEDEANSILSRLSENQTQVFIESLRDLKSGGVKETLDITVSDSAGMRPYEMFSGGEAFRVDFALRIAISKLLAHRAGTALQTLIIDEGFGSQDEDGLNRLMDSIYAIQKDFSKIIVVSHLTSFKDNFPVHFLVNKNSSGSFISNVEQRG